MRYIIIFIVILATSLMGVERQKQLVSPEVAMELLQTIKGDAIALGTGSQEVHSFIDPLCLMSQLYLALIYKHNKKIFAKYTIYLYLHEIESKKSKKHILNIMSAAFDEKALLSIMIDKEEIDLKDIDDDKSNMAFDRIADVARLVGVNKRPYIMINGRAK